VFYPEPTDLLKYYLYVKGLSDLFGAQQYMAERELRLLCISDELEPTMRPDQWQSLRDAEAMIHEAEESVAYIKRWALWQGWEMDFDRAEEYCHEAYPPNHPCNLIKPYLVATASNTGC
jgi:hypothetical protein